MNRITTVSVQSLTADSSEHVNGHLGSIKVSKFSDQLGDYQLLKEDSSAV
jgi:hypothetical protein